MDRQRIDKWLWHARVVRTRTAAADLVSAGHVRINGARAEAANRLVRQGDVVTIALDRRVRMLKVAAYAERRGSAEVASTLFEDLTPALPPAPAEAAQERSPGSGRPTKRERRSIARLQEPDDEFEPE